MSKKRLLGKKILVTAAAQGMGRAAALAFAAEGAKVFATDIQEKTLQNLTEEDPSIDTFLLDVLDHEAIKKSPDRTGPLTTLFNCAGYVFNFAA